MEVYVTGHSHNANGTLHYIYYGTYDTGHGKLNQAHANPNGVKNRNVLLFGVNCRKGYHQAVQDFNRYLRQKPNNKVQTLNVVLSFPKSEFNFNNKEDCYRASELASKFTSKAFPNHQAIIALQHDNKHNIPHVHCIVNAISMDKPYKTIKAKYYGIGRLRAIGADCIKDYDKQFDTKISGVTKHKGNGYQKPTVDQKRVVKALERELTDMHVTTHSKLRQALKDDGIKASFKRRGSRRKRKRKRRGRRRYKRNGLVFKFVTKNKNGKKHNHYVKASTLGRIQDDSDNFTSPHDYTLSGIDQKLDENKKTLKRAKANQRKVEKEARIKHIKAVHQRQQQQIKQHEQQLRLIKIERKKKHERKIKKERQLRAEADLQRKRSHRLNQVKSAIKESAIKSHQFDNVASRQQPEASQSDKRLSDELQHATEQTWRTGRLGKAVTRVRNEFKQAYQYVRSGINKVYNFINQKRKKHQRAKQEQRQKIVHPDYTHQHWFTNENGAIERTGEHLELYLQHATAFKNRKDNKVFVLATPYYRRDISEYYGGQPVYSIYSPRFKRYYHGQLLTLDSFNKIMRYSNQPTFSERKISDYLDNHKELVLINGNRTQIKPAPFKAPVYRYRGSYIFNQSKVAPSPTPFSYAKELQLNRKWHWEHDFNMCRCKYWNWYSDMYKNDRGKRPNPRNTRLLHDFQFQIEYAIRSGQKKRKKPLTPCNQIERGVDNAVNADPNDANNYTQPWYVHGTDKQPSDDGRGFE